MESFVLFKQLLGLCLLVDHLFNTPVFYTYFSTQMIPKSFIKNKLTAVLVWVLIALAGLGLVLNQFSLVAALFLLVLYRHFYLQNVDASVLGAGLLGHLLYVIAFYLLGFELLAWLTTGPEFAMWMGIFKLEIALIILSGGLCKVLHGYHKNEGAEYALVNPSWGKYFYLFNRLSPQNPLFRVLNWATIVVEILAGICLLLPPLHTLGLVLTFAVFVFALLVFRVNSIASLFCCVALFFWMTPDMVIGLPDVATMSPVMAVLWVFLLNLLVVTICLHAVQLKRWVMPKWVFAYIKVAVIIHPIQVWSVFTRSILDYFIHIELQDKVYPTKKELIYDGFSKSFFKQHFSLKNWFRYTKNLESCTLLTLFFQLKFKDHDVDALHTKLLAYAKTVCPESKWDTHVVLLRFTGVVKQGKAFTYPAILDKVVDIKAGSVETALPS